MKGCAISEKSSEALVATLTQIHAAGLRHGDIRPANIIVGSHGATLIDFDMAYRSERNLDGGAEELDDLKRILLEHS